MNTSSAPESESSGSISFYPHWIPYPIGTSREVLVSSSQEGQDPKPEVSSNAALAFNQIGEGVERYWMQLDQESAASLSPSLRTPITEEAKVRYDARVRQFLAQLRRAYRIAPVEDGYGHPADDILARALAAAPKEAPDWIHTAYEAEQRHDPPLAASILRSVGRLEEEEAGEWGQAIAITALSHANSEVRESAIRAFEHWEDDAALEILQHRLGYERALWLQEYLRAVIGVLRRESAPGEVRAR